MVYVHEPRPEAEAEANKWRLKSERYSATQRTRMNARPLVRLDSATETATTIIARINLRPLKEVVDRNLQKCCNGNMKTYFALMATMFLILSFLLVRIEMAQLEVAYKALEIQSTELELHAFEVIGRPFSLPAPTPKPTSEDL